MNQPLASIGQRFTAQFLDGLIALALAVGGFYLASFLGLPRDLLFVGAFVYLLASDGLPGGQSLGKRLTGIAVVHVETGAPGSYWQSFVRNLSLLLFSPFDELALIGAQRRRVGDFLARTKVVRTGL